MKNREIQNYTLKHLLGKGGMAEVWYAENNIGKKAAIKILDKKLAIHQDIVQRFVNEAKIMVDLDHNHIRKVYGYDKIDEQPIIIMEYLEGEDLSQKLKHHSSYTNQDLIQWWNQAVEALNHTHKKGIVHRDIKPSNLFITNNGDLKLLDFGIAKPSDDNALTRTGQMIGSPLYMSPEQVDDAKNLDYKTDVYSLAISFIQLITKELPYDLNEQDSSYKIQHRIMEHEIEATTLPKPWNFILPKYLHKTPEYRAELSTININENTNSENTILVDKKTEKTNENSGSVVEKSSPNKNSKFSRLVIPIFILIAASAVIWYFYPQISNLFTNENNQPTEIIVDKSISVEEAKAKYAQLHELQKSDSLDALIEVFSPIMDKYFDKENIGNKTIINDIRNYLLNQKEIEYTIKDFKKMGANHFKYSLEYIIENKNNGNIKEFDITGEIKFDENQKISYLDDLNTTLIKKTKSIFNLNTLEYSKISLSRKTPYPLKFDSKIVLLENELNQQQRNFVYSQVLKKNAIEWDNQKMNTYQKEYFEGMKQDDTYREYQEDYEYFEELNISVKFLSKRYICTEKYHYGFFGGAHGNYSKIYKNLDLFNFSKIELGNIIDVNKVNWNPLLLNCLEKYSDRKVEELFEENIDSLTYSENFYFDASNLYFVYQPYEIASFASGVIEIRVPFTEIKEQLHKNFLKTLP